MSNPNSLHLQISKTWDGDTPPDNPIINLNLSKLPHSKGIVIHVEAPFYNDPIPPSSVTPPGSTNQLWDYEVVELFFLNKDKKYLEVELGPQGHYLLLQLNGTRNVTRESLPLQYYKTKIHESRWTGEAIIPLEYFPENVEKVNAYAIHKSDPHRVYMALYPVPKGQYESPDFHRLDSFQPIDFEGLPKGTLLHDVK